jgi:hypothetical protein
MITGRSKPGAVRLVHRRRDCGQVKWLQAWLEERDVSYAMAHPASRPGSARPRATRRKSLRLRKKPRAILNAMASNGPLPVAPGDGWQQRTLPVLAGLAAEDARISGLRVHGSASGTAASADRWSDLDLMITATDPVLAAEDFARRIGCRLSPVFAASRSGDSSAYCVRLVLRDLRMIDVTATAPAGDEPDLAPAASSQDPADAVAELIASFRFDAVLAAVKAARGDVLIGAHLTLQLARHLLVNAMLLRDRDAGTAHHRFGGSRWDAWASRLAAAPAPYTQAGITAAIRFYTTMLAEIAAGWDPRPQLDNGPLLALLDAVDQHA